MKEKFKIGVGREVVSPKLGVNLFGYTNDVFAEKVHDDLNVSVIALEQGEKKGILISADICLVSQQITDAVKEGIFKETRFPCDSLTFASTHTHTGPETKCFPGYTKANEEYVNEILIPKTITAAKKAIENLTPAVMGISNTQSFVGVNRRQFTENGNVMLGQNPFGSADTTMTVMAFKSLTGENLVNIVHYNAHGTSMGRTPQISRDWPGVMVDRLEKITGATTVYFNGCIGDMGPRLSNGLTAGLHESDMEEIGALAALDATKAYKKIKEYREVDFKLLKGEIKLPYDKIPSKEEVDSILKEFGDIGEATSLEGVSFMKVASLRVLKDMYEKNVEIGDCKVIPQVIYAFNSTAIVPFLHELFSSIALRLRYFSPFENTLCVSNSNDSNGYLPAKEDIARGGYEVSGFFYLNPLKLRNDTDTTIIQENLKIMRKGLNK